MSALNLLSVGLAEDVFAGQDETGNGRLFVEIGQVLAAASRTLTEAFLTERRIRLAEQLARGAGDQAALCAFA